MANDMSPGLPISQPLQDVRTPEADERWRRWEERGRDNDARSARQLRVVVITAGVLAAAVMAIILM
jgi:hypothetical protein